MRRQSLETSGLSSLETRRMVFGPPAGSIVLPRECSLLALDELIEPGIVRPDQDSLEHIPLDGYSELGIAA